MFNKFNYSEKERLIAKLIDEGRGPELAAAMVEPMLKCGGIEYFEGMAHIWYGERLIHTII